MVKVDITNNGYDWNENWNCYCSHLILFPFCTVANFATVDVSCNSSFKLYYSDPGLLSASFDYEIYSDLINDEAGIYKGLIYENVVADLLKHNDFELYYYSQNSGSLEIDFVIRNKKYPLLIEVKARNNYAKSLKMVISNKENYGSTNIKALKLYSKNIVLNNDIINLPYYLLSYFNKDIDLFN